MRLPGRVDTEGTQHPKRSTYPNIRQTTVAMMLSKGSGLYPWGCTPGLGALWAPFKEASWRI